MKGHDDNSLDRIDINNIIDQIPGNIYWKSKDGALLGCNKQTLNAFGLVSLEDYLGKTDYDLFPKEQADKLTQADKEVIHTGKTVVTEEESNIYDGSTALFLSYKSPLKNAQGEIIGVSGISLDITKSNQEKTRKFHLLENIIALIPGHVYWKDQNGNYLGCNNEQARALGLSSNKDIVNKKPYENLSIDEANILREGDNKVLANGQTITLEEPGIRENGDTGIFLTKKTPLHNSNGQILGLLGISFDITERKQNEESLKKSKEEADIARKVAEESVLAKNEFIKNIEHDLRTPFSGILGLSQILLADETDPDKKEVILQIVLSAEQLLTYHNRVLDYSKIQTGKIPIVLEKFNVKNMIEGVVSIEKPAATNKLLDFNYTFDESIPNILMGDEYRLKRILLNIISNSIKFTRKGSIDFTVRSSVKNDESIILEFIIKDSGIGIPPDKRQYIFEQFTRLNPSNKGQYTGIGIGLKVVKDFVNDLSGNIDMHSEIDKGSIFILSIPFKIPLTQTFIRSLD